MATSILLRKALKNAIKNHHSFNLGSKRLSNNIYLNQKRFISFQHILSKLRGEKPKENGIYIIFLNYELFILINYIKRIG